tara:strand:- start:394 stop:606 length:213 start_codon:yes stop_codon:yes gene_type:complete
MKYWKIPRIKKNDFFIESDYNSNIRNWIIKPTNVSFLFYSGWLKRITDLNQYGGVVLDLRGSIMNDLQRL